DMAVYRDLAEKGGTDIHLPTETWVRTVSRYANAFHSTPRQRMKVLNTMIPLYYARVASLVNELKDKDARQSEAMFQDHAQAFEDMKGYLLQIWS
ncbi:MAG TPA: cell wall biosynthesis glycosyltransferase, partial [Deltaproteobacteria bacterium]|nr:cell wall biosynthesis glycosyltransferase [Deltaproteobacteria bacterium]